MSTNGASTPPPGRRARRRGEAAPWTGPLRHYDILKEATIAVVVVAVLTVALAVIFTSPDRPAITLKQWAQAQPVGFVDTAMSELDGTSTSATYGPPYNHVTGSSQSLGSVSIERLAGVRIPIDVAEAFVLVPLASLPPTPALGAALHSYATTAAPARSGWYKSYEAALAPLALSAALPSLSRPAMGPVPTLMDALLGMTRSGALDAALDSHGNFYNTDYTDPLLFLGDSAAAQDNSYWNQIVTAEHLQGSQWGVMNETGSWPGQPWLWLYSMWYQVRPMSTSGNADILVLAIMAVLSVILLLLPFIPGLRSIPRWIPVHRLIWRRYYHERAP